MSSPTPLLAKLAKKKRIISISRRCLIDNKISIKFGRARKKVFLQLIERKIETKSLRIKFISSKVIVVIKPLMLGTLLINFMIPPTIWLKRDQML